MYGNPFEKKNAFEDHLKYFQTEQLRLVTPAWCDVTQGFFPSMAGFQVADAQLLKL